MYYKREAYAQCYGNTITPINGVNQWEPCAETVEMLPPTYKKGPGRPKKAEEEGSNSGGEHNKSQQGKNKNEVLKVSAIWPQYQNMQEPTSSKQPITEKNQREGKGEKS